MKMLAIKYEIETVHNLIIYGILDIDLKSVFWNLKIEIRLFNFIGFIIEYIKRWNSSINPHQDLWW